MKIYKPFQHYQLLVYPYQVAFPKDVQIVFSLENIALYLVEVIATCPNPAAAVPNKR